MTQNEVSIIKNAVLDATEAYVDARLSVADFVKTQIGVTQGDPVKRSGRYYHTVKCDATNRTSGVVYRNVLSVGNIPFPANSVVFLIAPNAQFSSQFILGKLDDTPCHITGGSIDIGNGNFTVDSYGNVTIKRGSININNRFIVDSSGNMNATSGYFSGELRAARGTLSDGTGILSLSGGSLHMGNYLGGGAGVFAERIGTEYYSCWGAVNSAARDYGGYLEVATMDVIRAGLNVSDERLKQDIENINNDFAEKLIYNINPKQFKYKNTEHSTINELHFGVIAQEILKVEEECGITEDNRLCYKREMDDMLAVDYRQLIAPMIKVIQNQKEQLDKQQSQIDELKSEIEKLKKRGLK